MKKVGAKVVAMMLALVMAFSVVPGMAATVEAGNNALGEEIIYLDIEIEVVNGQPMMVIEGEEDYGEEYLFIPLYLPELISVTVNGQVTELEVDNNYIFLPTAEGVVVVHIEDFYVVMVDGDIAFKVEEADRVVLMEAVVGNPIPVLIKVIAGFLGTTAAKVYLEWTAGLCLCLSCFAPTPDGPYGDRFCDHDQCLSRFVLRPLFGP